MIGASTRDLADDSAGFVRFSGGGSAPTCAATCPSTANSAEAQTRRADPEAAHRALRRAFEIGTRHACDDRTCSVSIVIVGSPLRSAASAELGAGDELLELGDESELELVQGLRALRTVEDDLDRLRAHDDADRPAAAVFAVDDCDAVPFVVGEQAENDRGDDLGEEELV